MLKLQAVCAYNRKVERKGGGYYLAENYVNDEERLAEAVESVRRGVYRTNGSMDGFYPLDGRFSYFESEEQQANVNFIHTFSFLRRLNAQWWNHIVLTGLEKYVIEALRIVEPDVENLAFVEEIISVDYEKRQERVLYITLRRCSGRFPLNVIGDGMNQFCRWCWGL